MNLFQRRLKWDTITFGFLTPVTTDLAPESAGPAATDTVSSGEVFFYSLLVVLALAVVQYVLFK